MLIFHKIASNILRTGEGMEVTHLHSHMADNTQWQVNRPFQYTIVKNSSLSSIYTSAIPDCFNLLPQIEKSVLPDLPENPRNFVVIGRSEGTALTVPICVSM